MRRVVVTGMSIRSPLGNDLDEVSNSLRTGTSGVAFDESYAEMKFKCRISARVKNFSLTPLDRKDTRGMGNSNLIPFAYACMQDAVKDSGLTDEQVAAAGAIIGNGGPSTPDQVRIGTEMRAAAAENRKSKVGPFGVPPTMTSGPVAVIATAFGLTGFNYMIGAACATSTIAIGEAVEKIILGHADVVFAGGTESADADLAVGFDAMNAMCSDHNDDPVGASRPFDTTRSGFVIGEGAALLVLEELEHAKARGARIYAEVVGYGQSSDGHHLFEPELGGAVRSMRKAMKGLPGDKAIARDEVDYINTHGTSTPVGDANELRAIAEVFNPVEDGSPFIGSTKSLSGHSLGAAGAQEAVYTLLMMRDRFLAPSINITQPDPLINELGLTDVMLREGRKNVDVEVALSNSFGFGGVNATLIFRKPAV